MTALYVITNEYLALAEKLAGLDLDAQTIADTIEASGLSDDLATKAQGIMHIARDSVKYSDLIDLEIDRLRALKVSGEKVAAGLHKYLLENMERAGIQKITCPLFSISIRKNPPAVEILDTLSLPDQYWRIPTPKPPERAPDKAMIKSDLLAGVDVLGARMVQGQRLEIK